MAQMWKESDSWHIRKSDGTPINLNTRRGALYVLQLQRRLAEAPKRRGRKPRPTEDKGALVPSA